MGSTVVGVFAPGVKTAAHVVPGRAIKVGERLE
jgi:hypothetical protein